MPQHRRAAVRISVVLTLVLVLAACGDASPSPSPSASPISTAPDLSAIACATADPSGVGELTGAWSGSRGGVYYVRQVGDCVWWFGTEIEDIEPGVTGQPGFANVASGRVMGLYVVVEWADVPLGDIANGGGLTFFYDNVNGTLTLIEQRGDGLPFGDEVLTRIDPNASPDPSASASPSP